MAYSIMLFCVDIKSALDAAKFYRREWRKARVRPHGPSMWRVEVSGRRK
jgi:hypothetical protein